LPAESNIDFAPRTSFQTNRPAALAARPAPRKKSRNQGNWLSESIETLPGAKTLGTFAAVALAIAIIGWGYLPKSRGADIRRYQAMKQLLEEIKSKRVTVQAELPILQQKLEKTAKEIAAEVKDQAGRDEPAKQCLLWAARDNVPRFIQAGLATESVAETDLAARLLETAYLLGLEKRPPVNLAQLVLPPKET
jgi:hypothetical protein